MLSFIGEIYEFFRKITYVIGAEKAKSWWGKNVNQHPVWVISELPEARYKDILLSLNLGYEIRKGILVLGKPDTELAVLMHSYFWEVVSCILKAYHPHAITGVTAIQYYLGEESIPIKVDVLTEKSSIRIDLHGISQLASRKKS